MINQMTGTFRSWNGFLQLEYKTLDRLYSVSQEDSYKFYNLLREDAIKTLDSIDYIKGESGEAAKNLLFKYKWLESISIKDVHTGVGVIVTNGSS